MGSSLTSGQVLPGFYSFVDFNAAGAGTAPSLRALLWGTGKATGIQPFNMPYKPSSQQDADDASGRGSELASWFASAVSQPESQGAEVWIMPIAEPSGGVASTYKLKVVLSGANPTKPGTLSLWIKSQLVAQIGFDTSDTASTIATNLQAALAANTLDLPIGTTTVNTDTVTIPYFHKGTTGEDLPMQCDISPNGSGVALSPGQATFATNAAGAGTARVSMGSLSVSAVVNNADTPTIVAASVAAAWNSDNYPLTTQAAAGVVTFLFRNGRVARRMSAAVVTSTGTTVDMGSGVTSGVGSASSLTYNGTQGTGAPILTNALANLDKHQLFRSWSAPWVDTPTIGSLAAKMEAQADGSITGQKPQVLTVCSPLTSSVAGAIPTGTTPNLTTTAPRYAVVRCEDAPVQGMDLAARIAAVRAALWIDDPAFNWNGFQLKGNARAPILLPFDKPSDIAQNTDLRTYALAPVVKGPSGMLEIVKGRTTSLANDKRYWAWSVEAQAAYHATDLPNFLRARFQGGSTVRNTDPKAPGLLDANSVKAAVQQAMRKWEKEGNYDGADAFADFVQVTPDAQNPFRFNIKVPESPVLDLDQLVADFRYTSPST